MMRGLSLTLLLASVVLAACQGPQTPLDPQGPSARTLSVLTWSMLGITGAIWLAVVAVLAASLVRRRPGENDGDRSDRRMHPAVKAATVATAVAVAGLTLASFAATRSIDSSPEPEMTITVRGQQWWWQFVYDDGAGGIFETANEMHIPVGRHVRLELESPDVVHSFWVPSLAGKRDLVPGRRNTLVIRADRPGIYRGQCSEFCGMQHSHMALFVVADGEAEYTRWVAEQKSDARVPSEPEVIAGRQVFLSKPCAACHTVRGTPADGKTGPDLTHVGARRTIAAGLLENTRGAMAAWIADPQTLKPGSNMPLVELSGAELRQLSAYMESLK